MKDALIWGGVGLVAGVLIAFILRPAPPVTSSGTVPTPTSPATSGGASAAPSGATTINLSTLF